MDQSINQHQSVNLGGLFGHLSSSTGLYSRETFLNLYSTIVRIIRQYQLEGMVFHRVLDDPDFMTAGMSLEQCPNVTILPVEDALIERCPTIDQEHTGFFVALTNQFCATIYWSRRSEDTYGMLDGGWTFHPEDSRTIGVQIAQLFDHADDLVAQVQALTIDRRYDPKTTWLITQLVNNLETRNRELTQALQQVNVLNAKMLDQERLAAIGQLCSVIAHEIRNPLGLINLYATLIDKQINQLTLEEAEKDPLAKNLQLITSASSSLEDILSELTSYARPIELDLETMDVRDVVSEVTDMFEPKYEEKGVQLAKVLPEEAVAIDFDKRRVRQALINLVKNALEASEPDTQVDVVLHCRQNDDRVFIKVHDQGSGVNEQTQKKLFTPFFSTKGNGTGLGLAHSRKIMQAHGGTVSLLQTNEQGSIFALILPKTASSKQLVSSG